MRTTLNYNTIETLQRQPAWKKFVDVIVDKCSTLYDGNLIAEVEGMVKSGDSGVLPISTLKLSESSTPLQANYSSFDYISENAPMIDMENISLQGMLHMLSIYNCKTKDINLDDIAFLPHTYKTRLISREKGENAVWGVDFSDVDRVDDEVSATYEGSSESPMEVDCYDWDYYNGRRDDDIDNGVDVKYEYIHDIYGYNQKSPVLTKALVRQVRGYYRLSLNPDPAVTTTVDTPENIYIDPVNIIVDFTQPGYYQNFTVVSADNVYTNSNLDCSGVQVYKLNTNKGQRIIDKPQFLMDNYYLYVDVEGYEYRPFKKWLYEYNSDSYNYESSYIVDDLDKDEVYNGVRAIYNLEENKTYHVYLALSDTDSLNKTDFVYQGKIGRPHSYNAESANPLLHKVYCYYKDTKNDMEWIVLDEWNDGSNTVPSVGDYVNVLITCLKSQVFADECTLKAQPLFLYTANNKDYISTAANFSTKIGGENSIAFEIEKYDTTSVPAVIVKTNNYSDGYIPSTNVVSGISYGNYFYKWEQYSKSNNFLARDVYTFYSFDNAPASFDTNSLGYFFDGKDKYFSIDNNLGSNNHNNVHKDQRSYTYDNTFVQEYFETMYFNHFIKVSPIDGVIDGDTIAATKLYCDNLELVLFGDIVPYIASYDKKGVADEYGVNNAGFADFVKIVSYNERTHLMVVDAPVYFEVTDNPSKHVVVVYQNASPFSKMKSLGITAPTDSIKAIVKDMLKEYKDQFCDLEIKTVGSDEYEPV